MKNANNRKWKIIVNYLAGLLKTNLRKTTVFKSYFVDILCMTVVYLVTSKI